MVSTGESGEKGVVAQAVSESDKVEEEGDDEGGEEVAEGDNGVSFESLGVLPVLCEATAKLGWRTATPIQTKSIPLGLKGCDVIGLAETGSGKTGAFALPILQALLEDPQRYFAVILAPTRELAFQINEVFEVLGSAIGLHTVCVVGGVDSVSQAVALMKRPHIIIATPGRLVDHLENTKGFSLRNIRILVLDEADRMLSMDFEEEIDKVLAVVPRERSTFLFSATMTSKVAKLQRASLRNPTYVKVDNKFQTPKNLTQEYLFIPAKYKDCYLAYVLNEYAGQMAIIFVATCNNAQRVALLLRNLGFGAISLHGKMTQPKRLSALNKFKAAERNILIATDVASRGLDIPYVDLVVNLDIPTHGKDYVHRVGRTARAGRAGRSIAMVTQYDIEIYQRIEKLLGCKLPPFKCEESVVLLLLERVSEAQRLAQRELREQDPRKSGRRSIENDNEENADHIVKSFQRVNRGRGGGKRKGGRGGGKRKGGRGGGGPRKRT